MTKLTKRQQEILNLIESHMAASGSPPTRAEIAKTMGFRSPNAAEDHLRALARKGVIELVPGTSRGIRLIRGVTGIPIVKIDRIGASQPIFSENHIIATCKLDRSFFKPSINYLLQFTHKAIPELCILEGDYLAISQTSEIFPGQLMLIRSNQEVTVRHISIDMQHHNLVIEGLVVGVFRNLTKHPLLS